MVQPYIGRRQRLPPGKPNWIILEPAALFPPTYKDTPMATIIQQAIAKVKAALKTLETDIEGFLKTDVEPALETEYDALKPQILGLGETALSQIWTAVATYIAAGGPLNPGSAADAVKALVAQLPADLQALEHVVMAAFAGAVQSQTTGASAASGASPTA